MKHLFLITIASFVFCAGLPAQKNPFLKMIGKEYGGYIGEYEDVYDILFNGDDASRAQLFRFSQEAAAADSSGLWELEHRMVEAHLHFYDSRDGGFVQSKDYTAEAFAESFLVIAADAQTKGFPLLRLRTLYYAAQVFRLFVQDYDRAFAHYLDVVAILDELTTAKFPQRPHMYLEIAKLYYSFREYADAAEYYRKVVDDPDPRRHMLLAAFNELGLCYRNLDDYDMSDRYFTVLLDNLKEPIELQVWQGIAEGNIGYNHYLRGDPDTALRWMEAAIRKIDRPDDYLYVSHRATNIADIYLKKGDLPAAKTYIDMALEYHRLTRLPEKSSDIYSVLSRYFFQTGSRHEATAYLDSTLMTKDRENETYSGLALRRVEQRLRAADRKLHVQQLGVEKLHTTFYRRTAVIVSGALVIILVLLGFTLFFYRRKRNAYRTLVQKSQQWAAVEVRLDNPAENDESNEPDNDTGKNHIAPDKADMTIMGEIERLMTEQKLYRDTSLSIDVVAHKLNAKRHYISAAINHCTEKTFNIYVNELRIKEAVHILSAKDSDSSSIDEIAFHCGFGDRTTFYRAFKRITGLSPTAFKHTARKN